MVQPQFTDDDCNDYFARLGEVLADVEKLRTDATAIAQVKPDSGCDAHQLFRDAGICVRLKALYGVAYKNRKAWGAFPDELKDLRRFLRAPFAKGFETSVQTRERLLLEKMTMAARQDADERIYGRDKATHGGWADIWGLDVFTAKQWRTEKHSKFRTLVAQMLRVARRQQALRRARFAKDAPR